MARTDTRIPTPAEADGPGLADWAESRMLIESRLQLSRADLRQRMAEAVSEDVDVRIDLLLQEVDRRARIAPDIYPFVKTRTGMASCDSCDPTLYEFLLWLAISPIYRKEKRFDEIDQMFDDIVKRALVSYMGPGAQGVRFAHPSSDGRPTAFPDAIEWLSERLALSSGSLERRPMVKDGGVDVVAWRPFKDGRSAFAAILCQCTAQLQWTPKANDIVATKWLGWVTFGVPPLTALAVPFAVGPGFDRWDDVRYVVNIVLDRIRICELSVREDSSELSEMRAWNKNERSALTIRVA